MPRLARALGLAWMRTAGRGPPLIVTRPTPWICEIFAATRVSTMSCSLGSGSVSDIIASVMIGASVITLQFELTLSLDVAEQEVETSINAGSNLLPADLPMQAN